MEVALRDAPPVPPAGAAPDPAAAPAEQLALPDGWAGDLAWSGGEPWVAWSSCLDRESEVLSPSHWEWPARRADALRDGATPDAWRRLGAAPFTVSIGRVVQGHHGAVVDKRELGRSAHAVEGPTLAALPGHDAPAVVWAERRGRRSALLAWLGDAVEIIYESAGAILGPRAAVDGRGRLSVAWQQWPDGSAVAHDAHGPRVVLSARAPHAPHAYRVAHRPAGSAGPAGTGWSSPAVVSQPALSGWAPALCAGQDGALWCAWDAWDGKAYAIYAGRLRPEGVQGVWSEPVRVSPAGSTYFHFAPDLVAGARHAWIVWNRSTRWGELNHRFNHIRSLHAAALVVGEDGSLAGQAAPGASALGAEAGQLPVTPIPFVHMLEEEFVNPQAPRVRLTAGGPVVFYRQFRSVEAKDFGWSIGATRLTPGGWTPAAPVSSQSGFPDTPFGVIPAVVAPDAAGSTNDTWLLASHAGAYPRLAGRHPSRPVAGHRLVVERVTVGALSDAPVVLDERSGVPLAAAPVPPQGGGVADTTTAAVFTTPVTLAPTSTARVVLAAPAPRGGLRTSDVGARDYRLLFGDLHRHSAYSKCMSANDGDPLDHWRWAQDVAPLDFYALTEHLEYMSYLEWRRIDDLAQRLAGEGSTTGATGDGPLALCGFELAIPPGHTNFFYADESVGHDLRIACLTSPTLAEVWPKLDGWVPRGAVIAIRHHQGHRTGDLAATYAARWEPVVEIMQTRGEFPAWVQSLWRQGFRAGVVGASDHARGAPFVQCLTGLWVPPSERTREGVLAALSARRAFATNGPRMSVFLTSDGTTSDGTGESVPVEMGQSGKTGGSPRLHVQMGGTRALETVEVYRDAALLRVEPLLGLNVTEHTLDIVDEAPPPGEHAYWVRVTQGQEHNGRRPHRGVAYSSPVWLRTESPRGADA